MKNSKLRKAIKTVVRVYTVVSTVVTVIELIKARGIHKEDDKALIEEGSSILAGIAPTNDFEQIKVGEDTVLCKFSPYSMLFLGRIGSTALVLDNGMVLYDDNFRRLSKQSQVAVLAHELGHIKHQHRADSTYLLDRAFYAFSGKVLPMELEADAYAVSIVGKEEMIKALKGISKYSTSIAGRLEIRNRIKSIREM